MLFPKLLPTKKHTRAFITEKKKHSKCACQISIITLTQYKKYCPRSCGSGTDAKNYPYFENIG